MRRFGLVCVSVEGSSPVISRVNQWWSEGEVEASGADRVEAGAAQEDDYFIGVFNRWDQALFPGGASCSGGADFVERGELEAFAESVRHPGLPVNGGERQRE